MLFLGSCLEFYDCVYPADKLCGNIEQLKPAMKKCEELTFAEKAAGGKKVCVTASTNNLNGVENLIRSCASHGNSPFNIKP